VDTLAPSHVELTSNLAGSAANEAEKKKCAKNSSLSNQFIFVPVGFETFGPWGDEASKLVTEIGKRLTEVTGEKRATSYLKQRISMAIQRGNCASVLATIPSDAGLKEIYLL